MALHARPVTSRTGGMCYAFSWIGILIAIAAQNFLPSARINLLASSLAPGQSPTFEVVWKLVMKE